MIIKRDIYLEKLKAARHNGMIKVVTGLRRCGKSFLLNQLYCEYLRNQGVDDAHILSIDLEDRRNIWLRDPDVLLQYIDSKLIGPDMHYILIDEIQHVDKFEDVLNSYLNVRNADVYVTGSNSKFLSKDVITEFRGRGLEIKVYPLCFREFMEGFEGSKEDGLRHYLTYGGMPKLFDLPTDELKVEYLQALFAKVYLTDIKERYKIKYDRQLGELLDILASSIGGLTNPNKLSNTFKSIENVSISPSTINSYLEILQEVFMVAQTKRFDIKGKKYMESPAKYYFTDLGLRNARLDFRQVEPTHLMENLIYNELRVRGMKVDVGMVLQSTKDDEGKYVRRQFEVDFVCNQGSKRVYIQSAYRLPTPEKWDQETKSLKSVEDSFSKIIITLDPVLRHFDSHGILILNLYDFLLDPNSLKI